MHHTVDPVVAARGRLGVASRRSRGGTADPVAITEARRDLTFAKAERYVGSLLAADPPLTTEQRGYLASLLASGRPL